MRRAGAGAPLWYVRASVASQGSDGLLPLETGPGWVASPTGETILLLQYFLAARASLLSISKARAAQDAIPAIALGSCRRGEQSPGHPYYRIGFRVPSAMHSSEMSAQMVVPLS